MNIYRSVYSSLKGSKDRKERAERIINDCQRLGVSILTPSQYPLTLQNSHFVPPILFAEGNVAQLNEQVFVSIIGTRNPSEYGVRVTKGLTDQLRRDGVTVVSGLANGIDGIAHMSSICKTKDYIPTVAVLPCGHDTTYPTGHRELRARILSHNGTVISLYPPYSTLKKYHFLERNQLVAGLSLITVLIEGGERSGSLSTASAALKASRELYVLPGRIDDPLSVAPLQLLNMGAKPLLSFEAISFDLRDNGLLKCGFETSNQHSERIFISSEFTGQISGGSSKNTLVDGATVKTQTRKIPERWRNLLNHLNEKEYLHRDLLMRKVSIPCGDLDTLLLEMEMEDLVETNSSGVRKTSRL